MTFNGFPSLVTSLSPTLGRVKFDDFSQVSRAFVGFCYVMFFIKFVFLYS